MSPYKNQCEEILYLIPRLFLFSIFLVCLLITVFVSFDSLRPYMHPLETFRVWAAHIIRG